MGKNYYEDHLLNLDYGHVKKSIKSCNKQPQIKGAINLIKIFDKKYNSQYLTNKLYILMDSKVSELFFDVL